MNTEDLINQMSSNLKPVRPQSSPSVFSIQFSFFSFLLICLGVLFFHFRSDLLNQLTNQTFILEILFSLSLMASGFLLIAWTTSPGRQHGTLYKIGTSLTFLVLLILNCYRLSLSSIPFYKTPVMMTDLKCFMMVLAYSTMLSFTIFTAVKKRVVTSPTFVGALIGLISAGSGVAAISLHCANTGLIHLSLYHFILPLIVSSSLGGFAGKYFLRW